MYLKIGYCVIFTLIYQLLEWKDTFPCTQVSMRNGRCENRLCPRAPRARQCSCRIW